MKYDYKQAIKNTWLFQNYKMRSYVNERSKSFERMKADEKPDRMLLCRNSGTTIKTKVDQLIDMMEKINIEINSEQRFQTWIDTGLYVYRHFTLTDNIPPRYDLIVNTS